MQKSNNLADKNKIKEILSDLYIGDCSNVGTFFDDLADLLANNTQAITHIVDGLEGLNLLQFAAHHGKYNLAEFLLESVKYDPNSCGAINIAPILLAADANSFKIVELLIKHGADVFATDDQGRTAVNFCRSDKMIEIFKSKGVSRKL